MHGEPIRFGAEDDRKVLVRQGSGVMKFIAEEQAETGEKGAVVVHDATPTTRRRPSRSRGSTPRT